jgi:superfamily II DNA or RNA helicase
VDKAPSIAGWTLRVEPRRWQAEALALWRDNPRGIAKVVTGGGKTTFAFMCALEFFVQHPTGRVVLIVPTLALLDQWYVSLREELGVAPDHLAVYSGEEHSSEPSTFNLLVVNTARAIERLIPRTVGEARCLIVDECHRVATPANAAALRGDYSATLGLSATPEREYDTGFEDILRPSLGDVFYTYDYESAHADGVIAPFELINVGLNLDSDEYREYTRLSNNIGREAKRIAREGAEDEKLRRLLQQRARVSANAKHRVPLAIKLVEQHRGARVIVFHETVSAANTIHDLLKQRGHSVTIYHSRIGPTVRRENLRLFRRGVYDVLVCCRALDEGMNVPEACVAVVASSTASLRQRIQRLGRVLRPAPGKSFASIYTLYATQQERDRLVREEQAVQRYANVRWQKAS